MCAIFDDMKDLSFQHQGQQQAKAKYTMMEQELERSKMEEDI